VNRNGLIGLSGGLSGGLRMVWKICSALLRFRLPTHMTSALILLFEPKIGSHLRLARNCSRNPLILFHVTPDDLSAVTCRADLNTLYDTANCFRCFKASFQYDDVLVRFKLLQLCILPDKTTSSSRDSAHHCGTTCGFLCSSIPVPWLHPIVASG
jgi:hypothetical protein